MTRKKQAKRDAYANQWASRLHGKTRAWLVVLALLLASGCGGDSAPPGPDRTVADQAAATPAVPAANAIPQPKDSDGDGVADAADDCGGTPTGRPVDSRGCEPDADGDGVVDSADRCPDTSREINVGRDGCAQLAAHQRFQPAVKFASGQTNPVADSTDDELEPIVMLLKQYPGTTADVVAYTDSQGGAQKNQALSTKRAEAVAAEIGRRANASERVSAVGQGEANPIATNETAAGRAQNRRVEVTVRPRSS